MRSKRSKGTTLIEAVLSAALLLLVCLCGLEAFGAARRAFVGLKSSQEEDLAAAVALESLRRDAARAGEGLSLLVELGLCEAVEAAPAGVVIRRAGDVALLAGDVVAGQTRIEIAEAGSAGAGFEPGRQVCLTAEDRAEIGTVAAAGPGWIVLGQGAEHSYGVADGRVFAVESVTNWLDRPARVLRRRVNGGSGQPLLENAAAFEAVWEPGGPIVRFTVRLDSKKEKTYEACVVPKNLVLAPRPGEPADE
ncbi:MAG: hypothetical protein JW742_00055 [Candidatus Aminicenantes bacterium]|nr:hypothetical protein [Candidatus Aminicenantes bacterium]